MKIFSNFDTQLRRKAFAEYKKEYGADHVVSFGKSNLFLWFKVLFPLLFIILVSALWLWVFDLVFEGSYTMYVLIATLVLDIVFCFPIIWKYIDYLGDFIIVIPEALMLYDQSGLFKRDLITISARSIKTISLRKEKFLYSLFDNGDILVLSEGDLPDGEVTLPWVAHPETRKQQIMQIVGIDPEGTAPLS